MKAKEIRQMNQERVQNIKDSKFTGENLKARAQDFGQKIKGYKRERIKFL